MVAENGVKELQWQIEALAGASRAEREALRRSSITVGIVSCALLAVVAIFALINYNQLKDEWTEEKLSASFQRELEVLNPSATEELQVLGKHLLPIYARTGREQFTGMAPEIAERLKKEVDHLADNLNTDAHDRLTTAVDRVASHTEELTFSAYPGMKDDAEKARLTKTFHAATERAVTDATNEFGHLFATDVKKLEKNLHAFNHPHTDEPTPELEKQFIHLWLQLLDAEIMSK